MLLYTLKMAGFTFLQSRTRGADPLAPVSIRGRAWPWLCDYQLHINNAVYLDLMDYGRTQFFARHQLLGPMYRNGWGGVVAGSHVVYRRSIDLWRPFELQTRLLWFDDRWYVHEQNVLDERGRIAVRALVRSQLREGSSPLPMAQLLLAGGYSGVVSPAPTPEIEAFVASTGEALGSIRAFESPGTSLGGGGGVASSAMSGETAGGSAASGGSAAGAGRVGSGSGGGSVAGSSVTGSAVTGSAVTGSASAPGGTP